MIEKCGFLDVEIHMGYITLDFAPVGYKLYYNGESVKPSDLIIDGGIYELGEEYSGSK